MPNLLIPCSGPGTRSSGYTKFHKALNRVGSCAVIDHIIASYNNIDTVYVTLGYQKERVREYLTHAGYTNIEFIEIDNWSEGQMPSFRQIPEHVFDSPLYYNACDNWSDHVPAVHDNTFFTCNPSNSSYYDTDGDLVYSGISFMKDSTDYYRILQASTHNRNDLLIMKELDTLQHQALDTWYDIGNRESRAGTVKQFEDKFLVLDKNHQEVYKVNNRIIKLFTDPTTINLDNNAFPHPQPVMSTDTSLSYEFVEGDVNPYGDNFTKFWKNLENLWTYSLTNNSPTVNKQLWQEKTWQRFEMMCKSDEKYAGTLKVNGVDIDCTRIVENIDWDILNNGILGPCHGDLTMDNIIVNSDNIYYIDHRAGVVNDIFYDICKFYHSLHLHTFNLENYHLTETDDGYTIKLSLSEEDELRLNQFHLSPIYCQNKRKIELDIGYIWLSMNPLNVDKQLNKFLFLLAIQQLKKYDTTDEK